MNHPIALCTTNGSLPMSINNLINVPIALAVYGQWTAVKQRESLNFFTSSCTVCMLRQALHYYISDLVHC